MAPDAPRQNVEAFGLSRLFVRPLYALTRLPRRVVDRFAAKSNHPEPPAVNTGRILLIAAGWIVFVGVSLVGLGWYTLKVVPHSSPAQIVHAMPAPALQVAPPRDLDRLLEAQRERLDGYAWVDRERGLVQIPITRAMAIIVSRGPNAFAPLAATLPDNAKARAVNAATKASGSLR